MSNEPKIPWRDRNPDRYKERVKNHHLLVAYGITIEQYYEMLTAQGGCCAICGGTEPKHSTSKWFHVDHDHDTGRIRGLLCRPCNLGIGYLEDNVDRIKSAIEYLGGTHE